MARPGFTGVIPQRCADITVNAVKGFSPSEPQSASASVTSASATMFFFPNYQLRKQNLSPKTDNICIDCLYQQLQSVKAAKKCFQLI